MNFTEMLDGMLLSAKQVAILYIIVAVGFIADKVGLYTEKTALKCTDLLFYIVTPFKIIESFITLEYTPETAKKLFIAMGCGALLHLVAVLLCTISFNRSPRDKAAIYKYSSAYGNCGYMSLPLVSAIVGPEGVFYCSAVIISFQIFSFTHGIYIMSKGTKIEGAEKVEINFKKIILNPGVIAVIIGLPLFLSGITVPEVILKPSSYIASLNTPLAMLMFGTYMAHADFKSMFKNWRILSVAGLKLITLPAIMIVIYKLFSIEGALLTSLVISSSAPPANNTVMFAAKYGCDTGLASQVVSAVSLMSILTIPLMIGIAGVI